MAHARAEARRRGISIAALVRDGLERLLRENADHELRERAKLAVGGYRSGSASTSSDHDDVLSEGARW